MGQSRYLINIVELLIVVATIMYIVILKTKKIKLAIIVVAVGAVALLGALPVWIKMLS